MKKFRFLYALVISMILVGCPPDPIPVTVKVNAQSGVITAGTAGSATFAITTTGVDNGKTVTVQWFTTSAGTTATTAPAGITVTVGNVSNNKATITMSTTAAVTAGSRYFKVTIDGVKSGVITFTVADLYASFKADATLRFEGAGNAIVRNMDATHLFYVDKGGLFSSNKNKVGYGARDGSTYYFVEWTGDWSIGTKTSPTLRTQTGTATLQSLQILQSQGGIVWIVYKQTATSAEGRVVQKI